MSVANKAFIHVGKVISPVLSMFYHYRGVALLLVGEDVGDQPEEAGRKRQRPRYNWLRSSARAISEHTHKTDREKVHLMIISSYTFKKTYRHKIADYS